ncbi:hypothetical protein GCM10007860_19780 [Chitiniphilus shinanonensis]|uniref:Uncharacterized protein n=1 Tax=Chitiniphilus shinanonensis TaxID=553088 RepID=A0ABQ6BS47_9NEIS|nr:hypothetical protein GCM10007860_19780 [Chitiniphilus shinanonensis]
MQKFAAIFCRINNIAEVTREPFPLLHVEERPEIRRLMHSFCRLQGLPARPATHSPCDFNDSRSIPPELPRDLRPIPPGGEGSRESNPSSKAVPRPVPPATCDPFPPMLGLTRDLFHPWARQVKRARHDVAGT